jgi:hypothetical protein
MTTDIAILTPRGVAVAADSAISTLKGAESDPRRVHYSAEKLFELEPSIPVAVMLFGQNDLMGIPMGVWVKSFRARWAGKRCGTLAEYGQAFWNFLKEAPLEEHQEMAFLIQTARRIFLRTRIRHQQALLKEGQNGNVLSPEAALQQLEEQIAKQNQLLHSHASTGPFSPEQREKHKKKYGSLLNKIVDEIYASFHLSDTSRTLLLDSAILACSIHPDNRIGLVFTGYGEDEYLPTLAQYDLKGLWEGEVIGRSEPVVRIGATGTSLVRTFGQSDDVTTFFDGMAPGVRGFLSQLLKQTALESPELLQRHLEVAVPGVDEKLLQAVTDWVATQRTNTQQMIQQALEEFQDTQFRKPILDSLHVLPEPQLVAMARTLVKLVSFRQQISMESETVGGPIDVAFLDKGEGFKWVAQKSPLSDIKF